MATGARGRHARRAVLAASGLAAALALGACGGDDDDSADPGGTESDSTTTSLVPLTTPPTTVPPTTTTLAQYYEVQPGDTLSGIAQNFDIRVEDLIVANGITDPKKVAEKVRLCREVPGYRPMPIVYNEDDHFDFDKPDYNFKSALSEYASWGYFDYRMQGEGFDDGYQSVPVNWGISSPRKKAFFEKLKEITGE